MGKIIFNFIKPDSKNLTFDVAKAGQMYYDRIFILAKAKGRSNHQQGYKTWPHPAQACLISIQVTNYPIFRVTEFSIYLVQTLTK